jgi:hypothetical protein
VKPLTGAATSFTRIIRAMSVSRVIISASGPECVGIPAVYVSR